MMRTPFVMVYRVSPLTYLLGKPRVKVPRFAMVNLIAGWSKSSPSWFNMTSPHKMLWLDCGKSSPTAQRAPHAGGPEPR